MPDSPIIYQIAPSGLGLVCTAFDGSSGLSLVTVLSDNNAKQLVAITGRPTGDYITLTFGGQTTAHIPTIASDPASFFKWAVTGLGAVTVDLQVNIFPGGTGSRNVTYEVSETSNFATILGTATLDHGFPGSNAAPTLDPVLVQRGSGGGNGVPISRYGIGRYTTASGNLYVRVSCDGSVPNNYSFDADNLWVVSTGGTDIVRVQPDQPPATSGTGFPPYQDQAFGFQVFGDATNMYADHGTTVGTRYLVSSTVVRTSLEALSTVGTGNVTVTGDGSSTNPIIVTFVNTLGDLPQPLMTFAPTDGTVAVAEAVAGGVLPVLTNVTKGQTIRCTRDWRFYYSTMPVLPTVEFFFPQPLSDIQYKYAQAYQFDNVLTGPGWISAFDGGPAGGAFGFSQQTWNSSGTGATSTYYYRPTPPGTYRFSSTHPAVAGISTDVIYTVRDLDGNTLGTYHVDQTIAPSGAVDAGVPWDIHGTFTLGRSTNGGHFNGLIVTQTNGTGLTMIADCCRFERLSLVDPTYSIDPGDMVTVTSGHNFLTSQYGPAAAASGATVDNRSGGSLYTPSTAAASMKVGWNLPPASQLIMPFYTNRLYQTSNLDQYPASLGSSSVSIPIVDQPTTFGGDRTSAPTMRVGNYDLLWTGTGDATLNNTIPNGSTQDMSRVIFPGVDGNGRHRRTYFLDKWTFSYGTKVDLQIYASGPPVSGAYPCDIGDVWIVPKDTNVQTAPTYDAVLTSNLHGIRTMRHLDGLGAIEANCTDFSDYMKPQSHISRNIRPRDLSFLLSDNPVVIQDYVYNSAHFSHDFTRLMGAAALFTFTNPHGLANGMIFEMRNPTGDAATVVSSDGGTTSLYVQSTHPLLVHYIDAHNFVAIIANAGGFTPQHMTNVISNAGGLIYCTAGATHQLQNLVEISNAAGADFYFNTNFCNTDACLTAIGTYMAANLASGLKFRVECANEIWNYQSTPGVWAQYRSQVDYGSTSANDYLTYYCETAHHHHTLIKAAWVAGGRDPNDFRALIGGQTADPGVARNMAAYYATQAGRGWAPFDELNISGYLSNAPSFSAPGRPQDGAFYRVVDGMTPAQHLDMWEVHYKYGDYAADFTRQRDNMVMGGGSAYATVPIGHYESGPDDMLVEVRGSGGVPYITPNEGYRSHACHRHPRLYGILLDILHTFDTSGISWTNFFQYAGGDFVPGYAEWAAYRSQGEVPYVPGDPTQDSIQINQVSRQDLHKNVVGGAINAYAARFGAPGLTPGTVTPGATTSTTAAASATDATGGATPYTYQWYRSTTSGATGTAVTGQTTLTLADNGLTPSTTYYYTLKYTDSSSSSGAMIVSSNQVAETTTSGTPAVVSAIQYVLAFRNVRAG